MRARDLLSLAVIALALIAVVVIATQDDEPRTPARPSLVFSDDGTPRPLAAITPGQTDPRVTPANIKQTICVPGYSQTVRPPVRVTNRIKAEVAVLYKISPFEPRAYEGDHLIPISVGGSPEADGTHENFWNEPWEATNSKGEKVGARAKDGLEFFLYKGVCTGRLKLRTVQREIARDWYAAWIKYGKPRSPFGIEAVQ